MTTLALARQAVDPFGQAVTVPNLDGYDVVLANSSGGKDSEAMLAYLVELCDQQGVPRDRILVVYADLGRVVHPGTREIAQAQALHLGLRFAAVARAEDLLDQIAARSVRLREQGRGDQTPWPSNNARYCTSDQKTSQVVKLMTELVRVARDGGHTGPLRVLNCLGIRAEESPARAKKTPFGFDPAHWSTPPKVARPARPAGPAVPARDGVPHSKRIVHRWLPIFDWTTAQVWELIHRHGLPWHPAYRRLPRLSCVMCVLAGRRELTVAAQMYPALAAEYVALEQATGHPFKETVSMVDIVADAAAAPGPLALPSPGADPTQPAATAPPGPGCMAQPALFDLEGVWP